MVVALDFEVIATTFFVLYIFILTRKRPYSFLKQKNTKKFKKIKKMQKKQRKFQSKTFNTNCSVKKSQ